MIRWPSVPWAEVDMLWQRGKPYAQDLRERVFALADEGMPVGQVAMQLRVSGSYVSKVLGRRRKTGQTTALPQRCHVPPKLGDLHGQIEARVSARADATIAELRAWLSQTHKVSASTGVMWKTLAALTLTWDWPTLVDSLRAWLFTFPSRSFGNAPVRKRWVICIQERSAGAPDYRTLQCS